MNFVCGVFTGVASRCNGANPCVEGIQLGAGIMLVNVLMLASVTVQSFSASCDDDFFVSVAVKRHGVTRVYIHVNVCAYACAAAYTCT